MDEYREYVRRMADVRTSESFFNNSPDHAAVIIEYLFRTAQQEVCFLTTALSPEIFAKPEVVDAARTFLSDGTHSLRILFETDPLETVGAGHPFVRELRSHNNYGIRRLSPVMESIVKYHFTVADADSFRFEPEKTRSIASAAFGDERNGRKLQDIFEALWSKADEARLPEAQLA